MRRDPRLDAIWNHFQAEEQEAAYRPIRELAQRRPELTDPEILQQVEGYVDAVADEFGSEAMRLDPRIVEESLDQVLEARALADPFTPRVLPPDQARAAMDAGARVIQNDEGELVQVEPPPDPAKTYEQKLEEQIRQTGGDPRRATDRYVARLKVAGGWGGAFDSKPEGALWATPEESEAYAQSQADAAPTKEPHPAFSLPTAFESGDDE